MKDSAITTHIKLPFSFDTKKLAHELNILLKSEWVPHLNTGGYDGNWNVIALYAVEGNHKNIFAHHEENITITETSLLQQCPYLKEVIAHFECHLLSVRLLRLAPNSFIKPHCDYKLGYEDGCFRIHIPIVTNPKVSFMLDNQLIEMRSGECWYTNTNYIHSVANQGETDRVHLVIDGQRNDWSDELFFSLAPKESFLTRPKVKHDAKTIQNIIRELERNPSDVTKELIQNLQNELNELNK